MHRVPAGSTPSSSPFTRIRPQRRHNELAHDSEPDKTPRPLRSDSEIDELVVVLEPVLGAVEPQLAERVGVSCLCGLVIGDAKDEGGGLGGVGRNKVLGSVGEEALRGLRKDEERWGSEGVLGGVGLVRSEYGSAGRKADGKQEGGSVELTSSQHALPEPQRPVPVSSQIVP